MASGTVILQSAMDLYMFHVRILLDPAIAMSHVSYSELRANLAHYLDDVSDSRSHLVVTRRNARNVVMIDEEEFEALLETMHLLRSPANAARLMQSIAQADAGEVIEHPLLEEVTGPRQS